jgi:heterogeneous nuclear rnp K-like protein
MADSPSTSAAPASQKRPLEEPSSPSGPGDQPDAKRPALDKVIKSVATAEAVVSEPPSATAADSVETPTKSSDVKVAESTQNGSAQPSSQPANIVTSITAAQIPTTNGQAVATTTQQDESQWLHIRAIISSAEAATVIGKGGENVTLIRRHSGAKCTVSDYSRGAVERILTVSGPVDAVAKV